MHASQSSRDFRSRPQTKLNRATTTDRHDIARAYHAFWHETHAHLEGHEVAADRDVAFFKKRLANLHVTVRIAREKDGSVLGFAIWQHFWLRSLFLAPKARGHDLGKRLLAEAERSIGARGYKRVALICIVGNFSARRFYQRHGYRVFRLRHMPVKTTHGEVIVRGWEMQKVLRSR